MTEDASTVRVCPDCGAQGMGAYCSQCGEEMEPRLPTVRHYLRELLHELVELDSKLVRTIPALFRPGFLTKEYIAGRRQRYLKPSRLYLLIAIFFFLLFGSMAKDRIKHPEKKEKVVDITLAFSPEKDAEMRREGAIIADHMIDVAPYVVLLCSTPMLALVLNLLYWKKRLYVEHLIFSYHFFAFALIVIAPGVVLDNGDLVTAGLVALLLYLFVALKRVYADRGMALVLRCITTAAAYAGLMVVALLLSLGASVLYAQLTGELPKGSDFIL